jgi:hypothetical protein
MNAPTRRGLLRSFAAALSLALLAPPLAAAHTGEALVTAPADRAGARGFAWSSTTGTPAASPLAFDEDRLGGWLMPVSGLGLGGRFDFRGALTRDEASASRLGPALRLGAWWDRGQSFSASLEMSHRRSFVTTAEAAAGDERAQASRTELTRAWLDWRGIGGAPLRVTVGRQEFEDPRGWLYDRSLDAVRLDWRPADVRFELSAGRTADIERTRTFEERGSHVMALVEQARARGVVGAYAISRDLDDPMGERRLYLGGHSRGSFIPQTTSWLDVALLFGERDDHDLRGFGADAGLTWAPPLTAPFDFTLGHAVGSGGPPQQSGDDDRTFHQTGWHDNTASIGGRVPLHSYGEVLDPELSNLAVTTLGTGARLGRHAVDLLWHGYRQAEPSSSVAGLNVDGRASGLDADLGQGLDLVYGTELGERLLLVGVLGAFEPGAAFAPMTGTGQGTSTEELAGALSRGDRLSAPIPAGERARTVELRLRYLF